MTIFRLSDQITIFASIEGSDSAPPVVLLHGLGANADSWILQVPALVQSGFRTISPDFRGFGRSPAIHDPGISDLAADIVLLLDLLAIQSAHLVGISLGGTIALQLVLDWPERVSKMVLINTFARLWPVPPRQLLKFLIRLFIFQVFGLEAQARSVTRAMFPDPSQSHLREGLYAQIIQSNPNIYRHIMRELAKFDVRDRLPEIRHPVLVLTGSEDQTVNPKTQSFLAENIPGAVHRVIPGAGHGATGQQPEFVNQAILDFLR